MFKELILFEIKNRLLKISTLIYFAVYFCISFFMAIILGDVFQGISINFGFSDKVALNSPVIINYIITSSGYWAILIIAPIFGQSIAKDFSTQFQEIIFSTPIRNTTYFFVRYFGSFIATIIILFSIGLGIWIATLVPFVDKQHLAQNHFFYYLSPYLYIIIPNILFFGAIFISVVAIFKKMTPVYIFSIVLFTSYLISITIISDIDNEFIGALLDPFGSIATKIQTQYWSIAEQNTKIIPFNGYLLCNRLFWLAIGFFFLLIGYFSFNPFKLVKEKKNNIKNLSNFTSSFKTAKIPLKPKSLKVLLKISISEFKQAFSNIFFLIILLCNILFIFISAKQLGKIYGTETFPVTYKILECIGGTFQIFTIIIISYYAGELVWKDRDHRFYELVDSKPVSSSFLYLSKLSSLILIQLFLSSIIFISGIIIQVVNNYYNFELSIYFQYLIFYFLLPNIFTCIIALFIHTISRNKYTGHSVVILYCILLITLPSFGFDHYLYLIGSMPIEKYSDMNKFGPSLYSFMMYTIYWGIFHIGLAFLTILFWKRGTIIKTKKQKNKFAGNIQPFHKKILLGTFFCWITIGCFIFYNTNILNTYKTKSTKQKEMVDYEIKYQKYKNTPHPEIQSVVLNVDIFPESQALYAKGEFKYKNCSDQPITKILLNIPEKSNIDSLEWSKKTSLISRDKRLGITVYNLNKPLKVNEEIKLTFQLNVKSKGFQNSEFSEKIVKNGTFFHGTDFFPLIGYCSHNEINAEKIRRKYNLPEKLRMYDINDKNAVNKIYFSEEGSWINFEATLSTAKDQIAIAPGCLVKEWEENNRKFFHYKTDKPILNLYAFLSGRYTVKRDQFKNINIEIFHHPDHIFNIDRMVNAIKKSLDYYTKKFSPYQFKQIRIIEFPRYKTYAQSSPNTIFYSEGLGFIAKINDKDPENIDYVFYVTAHEIAHQWWAHQVIGANVQGATMLSESLAQYSALMVQEKEYGPKQMQKFLKYELNNYLSGRRGEQKKELPLMLTENQQYIHYNKGSLIFYALKDYLGEETVNSVLRKYIKDMAFQKSPFTRSVDLVERFKKAAPESKKYLIKDFFETITFYSNLTKKVTFKKDNDKYLVKINSDNKKFLANAFGEEQEIPMNDYIDIGVFDKEGNILYLQKHKIKNGINSFIIAVEKMPYKAGVDPMNKLIDKKPDSHLLKATAFENIK